MTALVAMVDVFDYLKLEVRRTLRDVGFVVGGIGMPVVMYLLFTNIGASDGPGGPGRWSEWPGTGPSGAR